MGQARELRCVGLLAVAAAGLLVAGTAPASAAWMIENLTSVSSLTTAPALAFDAQDRPHMVYSAGTGTNVMHVQGTTPGGFYSGWTAPKTTGIMVSNNQPGISHLAAEGSTVYLTYSPDPNYMLYTSAKVLVNGVAWETYTPLERKPFAVTAAATDSTGKAAWVVDMPRAASTPVPGVTGTGYHLVQPTSPTSVAGEAITTSVTHYTGILVHVNDALMRVDGDAAFDGQNNLHTVQYYEIGSSGFLMYAKGPAGGPFIVDTNAAMGWTAKSGRPSIAVDGAGRPHIAYTEMWPGYGVNYTTLTDTGWVTQQIDASGNLSEFLGTFPEIIVDKAGQVHVVYADGLHGLLKHAVRSGDAWQIETIDTISKQSLKGVLSGSLAAGMDSAGGIGVGYWDGAMMKYAYLPVPEPTTLVLLLGGAVLLVRRRAGR